MSDTTESIQRPLRVEARPLGVMAGSFDAMASPCEVLMATNDVKLAHELTQIAAREAWRIEQKFSRYRRDGVVARINTSQGQPVVVDDETAQLLDFAFQCYHLSGGLFDITSGVLRRVWKFDGSDRIAEAAAVEALLPLVGLAKASWDGRCFTLPAGMEIDLGGIGKEYAVDRSLSLLQHHADIALLVNYGGDIAANRPPHPDQPWQIGIEAIEEHDQAKGVLAFLQGGIATSGDSRRYLQKDGVRYGHILNPLTGWPVVGAPHAVTVLAPTCTQAGILSTLAMLQGAGAEAFLDAEGARYWTQR